MKVQTKQSPGINTALRAFENLSNNEKAYMLRKLKINNSKTSTTNIVREMQSMSKSEMQKLFEALFKLRK